MSTKLDPEPAAGAFGFPTGVQLLHEPSLNKGTGFPEEERDSLRIRGLLPPRVNTLAQQAERVMGNYRLQPTELAKYVHMVSLQDRNETLFYRVVLDHLEEIMPIIYTPVVGKACQEYGHIFQRPRGLFLSLRERGRLAEVLRNWPYRDIRVIVVTDGERILGLGDLGANGMGIPVGKLSLYTACAGIHPTQCLPITLDVGTDNEALLNDPLYIGIPQKRLRGEAYETFIDEFVTAAGRVFPKALIQFEDFANFNAFPLLERYRDRVCTFNDDIQGTASVTLAGIYSALRLTGGTMREQKLLMLGAGEAGIGFSDLMISALMAEGESPEAARKHVWLFDSKGLLVTSRPDLTERKRRYAQEGEIESDFLNAIRRIRPTGIIGVSGQPKKFNRAIVEEMAAINERPIIFSLSNPTSKTECTAEDAYTWSDGRAVFASGSPFLPLRYKNRSFVPGQGNNAYIFPGVGLGVIASAARRVTDEMFFEAARTLAADVTETDLETGCIFPSLTRIREVSAAIATRVADIAFERGLATVDRPADLRAFVESLQYQPAYRSYV